MPETRSISRFDFYLFGLLLGLISISMVILFGTTSSTPGMQSKAFTQLFAALLGLTLLAGLQLIDYRIIIDHAYIIYWSCIGLLFAVLVSGMVVKGAKSWILIPVIHMRFQPSELMKIAFLLAMSRALAKREKSFESLRELCWPIFIMGLPFALVVAQRDPGTALVFPLVALLMFWAAGVKRIYLFLLMSPAIGLLGIRGGFFPLIIFVLFLFVLFRVALKAGVPWLDWIVFLCINIGSFLASPFIWQLLKPHQRERLLVFLNPAIDPMGNSWNLIQSKVALGSGGLWGKGWQQGTQIKGQFLPAFHTDFAFSVLGEEWGFIGCFILMLLFFLFLLHALDVSTSTRYFPGSLLGIGVISLFFVHIVINVGMCMGLMPIIGIPLCFISYGGSAMVSNLLAASFLFNIQIYRYKQ